MFISLSEFYIYIYIYIISSAAFPLHCAERYRFYREFPLQENLFLYHSSLSLSLSLDIYIYIYLYLSLSSCSGFPISLLATTLIASLRNCSSRNFACLSVSHSLFLRLVSSSSTFFFALDLLHASLRRDFSLVYVVSLSRGFASVTRFSLSLLPADSFFFLPFPPSVIHSISQDL